MTDQSDVYEVLAELAPAASSYLCIGVQEGECLRHVVEANPAINVVLCDTWGPHFGGTNRGSHGHILTLLQGRHRGTVEFLDGDSKVRIPPLAGRSFDLTYVDGDHSTEGALADLRNVWPLTVQHMVVHDTNFPEVAAALETFLTEEKPFGITRIHARQGLVILHR